MFSKNERELDRFISDALANFEIGYRQVSDFHRLNERAQTAFVLYLVTELRGRVPFGPDPTPLYSPPGLWLCRGTRASCGGYSYLLQALLSRLGFHSRFVYFATAAGFGHCALEIFYRGGLWFVDPLFKFPGTYAGGPRGVAFWRGHLEELRAWEDNFCAHKIRYGHSLAAFFHKVRYDDSLIGQLSG